MGWGFCGPVDWLATGSMLSGIGTVLGVIAVVYAAYRGSNTYNQWRKQKGDERRIDLAEQVMTLAYKLKRGIQDIRSPLSLGAESAKAEQDLRERKVIDDNTSADRKRYLVTAQGVLTRIQLYKEQWDALLDIMPVSKAVFGDDVETQLNVFWQQRGEIAHAAHDYSEFPLDGPATGTADHAEELRRLRRAIWSHGHVPDTIATAVDNAIAALEAMLLPIIRGETPFGVVRLGTGNR